jgi:small subunit ribosomal protein S11
MVEEIKDEKKEAEKTEAQEIAELLSIEKAPEFKESKESADSDSDKKKKKKIKRQIQRGQAHIQCTYNNTIITITDLGGMSLGWASAGSLGFKGAKKSTPYAATQVAINLAEKVKKYGLVELEVFVKGVGSGREASIRALVNKGLDLVSIKDITPIPHNGCRPRKPRRV